MTKNALGSGAGGEGGGGVWGGWVGVGLNAFFLLFCTFCVIVLSFLDRKCPFLFAKMPFLMMFNSLCTICLSHIY